MKKVIAYLLTALLVFSSIIPAYAEDGSLAASKENAGEDAVSRQPEMEATSSDGRKEAENTASEPPDLYPADQEETDYKEGKETSSPKGNIVKITMATARTLEREEAFEVSLKGAEGTETKSLVLKPDEEGVPQDTVVVFEAEPGTYELEVSNPKYLAYTQELEVDEKYNYTITLLNGWLAGYEYEQGSIHPGVLRLGDVNQDSVLDDRDADKIIRAIEADQEEDNICDLNSDGRVSLADLQCLAESIFETGDPVSSLETSISANIITAAVDTEKVIVEGKLENILGAVSEMVQLRPVSGVISEEQPIELAFPVSGKEAAEIGGFTLEGNENNLITQGIIRVELENGEILEVEIPDPQAAMMSVYSLDKSPSVSWENGVLVVDFAGQTAVKKVTIIIKGTQSNNLAEISSVEFLNNMESRIPAPQMDIPENLSAKAGNKQFRLSWSPCVNVTGYEVEISDGTATETRRTAGTSLDVMMFQNAELVNKTEYIVRVQSVNGDWKSGYSEFVTVIPFTADKPAAPDNLTVRGGYRSVTAGWKQMEDTDTYNLYYKKESDTEFTKISGIPANSYNLTGLEDLTAYEIYVTGVNDNGEGPESLHAAVETINIIPANLPQYRLINTSSGEGNLSSHISSASIQGSDIRKMIDSPLDDQNPTSALGVFDNLYTSYYMISDWDDGNSYYAGNKGLTVTLDQPYHVGYISFAQAVDTYSLLSARVYADGQEVKGVSLVKRADENGRSYYVIKFPAGGVTAEKFQICINAYYRGLSIAEMHFHEYDSLEDDVLGLFNDNLYTTLKEDVAAEDLEELQKRLDTRINNEYHIDREAIQKELDNAKGIFAQQNLGDAVSISSNITAGKDGGKGFGGLNAWQPLGVSAYAEENIVIYVGSSKGAPGDTTDLRLYAAQYHSESGGFSAEVSRLKVGRNEISIPKISSLDYEKGGSLYVAYTGNNQNDQYAVRVSGGVKIPVLNLYQVEEEEEWNARITAYIEELEEIVPVLSEIHKEAHGETDYEYDEKNCIAGATEIMLNHMMYSVSSKQILEGLGEGTIEEKTSRLSSSLTAMEQMMTLYYQHKGLNDNARDQADKLPSQHLNIRYHRMFAGAFMYASGNHIGIEWNQVKGLACGQQLVTEDGKYVGGQLFGWGIGHEIGHNINQSAYAVAEITNNYFAQLSTRGEEVNDTARFRYTDVYRYVTSNSIGRCSDQAVALAMYWQLHLAYDRGYNYKIYDDYEEQLSSLFYARVDTYARTVSKAPSGNGTVSLTLSGDADQDFIRLASAAAEKDLTEFFVKWGIIPNEETTAYISQFEPETRAIYYVNDESRVYEIENGTAKTVKDQDILRDMKAVVDENIKNKVTIQLGHTADPEAVLGYEITRCIISGGEVQEQVIGFTTENEFTDYVTTINNRVVTYKVTAVDHFMNRSAGKTLDPVKIEHEGEHEKSLWDVEINNITPDVSENTGGRDEEHPDEEIVEDGRNLMIDNDSATVFGGTAAVGKEASVVLDFHQSLAVTGIRYRAGGADSVGSYKVYISQDKANWQEVCAGRLNAAENDQTIYFQEGEDAWICSYDAVYLKFVIEGRDGKRIAISEIDVLGPTGDNVDFRVEEGGQPVVGILRNDYVYDSEKKDVIPAGSLVFIGRYKGNPAYNVGLLYDENGLIVGGTDENGQLTAKQIILADVPEEGELGETYDGTWIYWITPENLDTAVLPKKVRAELYRVNDALTNEGQRLVSDSMFYDMPAVLPEIELTGQ